MENKSDPIIKVEHLTKNYGHGRGVFDISFEIPAGKVFGYCGTNGSGKTTTLRHIMGFIKPDSGKITVDGYDAWKDSELIKPLVGYIPGEIAFPDVKSGSEFLKIQAELLHMTNMEYAEKIINSMQLDPTANLKRMSKGMKQKTAIVCAFMNSPKILILDEPTTGLDPLMRAAFVNIILEQKKKGATVLMSSHMFEEMEETCDYVGLIKDGHLLEIVDMEKLHKRTKREYKIEFVNQKDYEESMNLGYKIIRKQPQYNQITIQIEVDQIKEVFRTFKKYELKYISEVKYTLEKYFLELVSKIEKEDGGKKDGSK